MSQITNKTLTILLKTSKHVQSYLGKDMASYGLNQTEFVALEILLNKGPQTIQSISERILMPNSSLTYVIENLLGKKLISKKTNSKDKRAFVIDLTSSGKELITRLFKRHEQTIEELFNVLSDEEINMVASNLKKIGLKAQALKEK